MILGSYNEDYKHCILNCKNGEHFFRIPNNPEIRQLWLDKLGLKLVTVNSRVCNNHFSGQMFTQSEKRLTKTAIPDKNIPPTNGDSGQVNVTSQLERLPNNLCSDVSNIVHNQKSLDQTNSTPSGNQNVLITATEGAGYSIPKSWAVNNRISGVTDKSVQKDASSLISQPGHVVPEGVTKEIRRDASSPLMNYQLRNQGQHVCKVIELPQFVMVFTAFKAKDTFIIPPKDFVPEYTQTKEVYSRKKLKTEETLQDKNKLVNETIQIANVENLENVETIKYTNPPREIKYVHYKTQANVVRRERETQSDLSTVTNTTEIAVQCDLEDGQEIVKDDNSQLEWINHIIKAHVFKVEGGMYECHICGEIAASPTSKLKHSMVHKESSSLCFRCGRLFTNHVKLKSHEKMVHLENKLEIKKALRCPKFHCTKAFHSKRQLFDHIDQHTKNTEQRCGKCLRSFTSSMQLHRHKSRRNCWR